MALHRDMKPIAYLLLGSAPAMFVIATFCAESQGGDLAGKLLAQVRDGYVLTRTDKQSPLEPD